VEISISLGNIVFEGTPIRILNTVYVKTLRVVRVSVRNFDGSATPSIINLDVVIEHAMRDKKESHAMSSYLCV
jgi:hypothetical protein